MCGAATRGARVRRGSRQGDGSDGVHTCTDMQPWPSSSGACPKAVVVLASARVSISSTRSSIRSVESAAMRSPSSRAIALSFEFGKNGPLSADFESVLGCGRGSNSRDGAAPAGGATSRSIDAGIRTPRLAASTPTEEDPTRAPAEPTRALMLCCRAEFSPAPCPLPPSSGPCSRPRGRLLCFDSERKTRQILTFEPLLFFGGGPHPSRVLYAPNNNNNNNPGWRDRGQA